MVHGQVTMLFTELQIQTILFMVSLVFGLLLIIVVILKSKPKPYIPPEILNTLFEMEYQYGNKVYYRKVDLSELYICVYNNKVFFSKTKPVLFHAPKNPFSPPPAPPRPPV